MATIAGGGRRHFFKRASRLDVIFITAFLWSFPNTRIMERTVDDCSRANL